MNITKLHKFILAIALVATASLYAEDDVAFDKVAVGGKGFVAVVNTCNAKPAVVASVIDNFYKIMMIKTEAQTGKWSLATAADDLKATKANAAIFLVDDSVLPMSLVALESKWAVINVKGLSDLAFQKELQRMLCVILGSPYSKFDSSTLRPAFSAKDLETMKGDGITFDTLISVCESIKALGIEQWQIMDREDAIEEGYLKK